MAWFYDQPLGDLTPFPHFVAGMAVILLVAAAIYGLFVR
jgi:hypothetical protein